MYLLAGSTRKYDCLQNRSFSAVVYVPEIRQKSHNHFVGLDQRLEANLEHLLSSRLLVVIETHYKNGIHLAPLENRL